MSQLLRNTASTEGVASLEIALATYNGAHHLPALLGSLFAQSCQDFRIVVADDNSSDTTRAVLTDFQSRYPGRIRVVGFSTRSGGAAANFARLSNYLRADYVSYCDQDDVWLPHKVAASLERIRAAEARHGHTCPILIHTELELVDSGLRRLHPSFWRYISIDPERHDLRELLVEMSVAGCTLTVNRAHYELARPIPPEAVMHDHWLALVAAALGKMEFISEPSVLYRQHGSNVSRRREKGSRAFLQRMQEILGHRTLQRDRENFDRLARQAGVFLVRYGQALAPAQRHLVRMFASLPEMGRGRRCVSLLRNGVLRTSFVHNLALFYVLLHTGRDPALRNARRC